jgi:hypothetical protein
MIMGLHKHLRTGTRENEKDLNKESEVCSFILEHGIVREHPQVALRVLATVHKHQHQQQP